MRLFVVASLSLLMFGCGGGDSASSDNQQAPQTPVAINPTVPVVWRPSSESSLNDADVVKSAIISTFTSIQVPMKLSQEVFNKLPESMFDDVPLKTTTTNCDPSGTSTISLSKQGYDYHSKFVFGECAVPGMTMNGEFTGDAVIGVSFGSGSGEYGANGSITSEEGDGLYVKTRVIKHDVMSVIVNSVTDELSLDITTACQSSDGSCNTMGTVITKTTSPIQFVDSLATAPVGGEIMVTNTANRIWLVKVVQNGFEIYDPENSTTIPLDYLSWYELTQ